jgi:hypothetical protein
VCEFADPQVNRRVAQQAVGVMMGPEALGHPADADLHRLAERHGHGDRVQGAAAQLGAQSSIFSVPVPVACMPFQADQVMP